MFADMRCFHLFSLGLVIMIIYCLAETDIDEAELDEHAYDWDNIDIENSHEVKRQRKSSDTLIGGPRSSSGRGTELLRSKRRFRGFRGRPRSRFRSYGHFPSVPSVRKPAVKPAAHHPQVADPSINKPSIDPIVSNGNQMSHRQNPLMGNSRQPGEYHRGQPNTNHPNANANPPSNGGNGAAQPPSNTANNRPGIMPLPIPIPLPFGGNHFGAQNRNKHNNNTNNTGKGNSGDKRHCCDEVTKRLLFTTIIITAAMMYYLQ